MHQSKHLLWLEENKVSHCSHVARRKGRPPTPLPFPTSPCSARPCSARPCPASCVASAAAGAVISVWQKNHMVTEVDQKAGRQKAMGWSQPEESGHCC